MRRTEGFLSSIFQTWCARAAATMSTTPSMSISTRKAIAALLIISTRSATRCFLESDSKALLRRVLRNRIVGGRELPMPLTRGIRGGEIKPVKRRVRVARHAITFRVLKAQHVLGYRKSLFRRLAEPIDGRSVILGDALPR